MGRTGSPLRKGAARRLVLALLLALALLLPRAALVGAQLGAGDEEGSLLRDPRAAGAEGEEEEEEEDGGDWLWRGDALPPPPPGNGTNGTETKSTLAQVRRGAIGAGRGCSFGPEAPLGQAPEQQPGRPRAAGPLAARLRTGEQQEQAARAGSRGQIGLGATGAQKGSGAGRL